MMGGDAPMVMAVMWALTAIIIIFVLVRLYTRAIVLHQVGADDYVYSLSGVSDTAHGSPLPQTNPKTAYLDLADGPNP